LVTLLIEKQGRYHTTKAGPVFDSQHDADAYNQVLETLNAMEETIQSEQLSNSKQ
jgi:hypothetical protein